MTFTGWIIVGLIVLAGILTYMLRKLTLVASITAIGIAVLIYTAAGWASLTMLAVFFILGTAATSYKKSSKINLHLSEAHETQRRTSQVIANSGIAAVIAILALTVPAVSEVSVIMIAGSFSAGTGDTLSSEFGNVHGRNFYNIVTLKKDVRGLDGVISLEGTIAGILGSAVIASTYCAIFGWNIAFAVILIAGIVGNLFDSYMGALFERRGLLGNDVVNFLNTMVGALTAVVIS